MKSPKFPQNYENNIDCTWLIEIGNDKFIEIEFLSFELEHHYNCKLVPFFLFISNSRTVLWNTVIFRNDFLAIYDGVSNSSHLFGKHWWVSFMPFDFPFCLPFLRKNGNPKGQIKPKSRLARHKFSIKTNGWIWFVCRDV